MGQQPFQGLSRWDNCQIGLFHWDFVLVIYWLFHWVLALPLELSFGFCGHVLMSESSETTTDIVLQNILRHQVQQHRAIADLKQELHIVKTPLTEIQLTLHVLLMHHGITITKPPTEAERGSRE